jgi:hypothetical protein
MRVEIQEVVAQIRSPTTPHIGSAGLDRMIDQLRVQPTLAPGRRANNVVTLR